MRLALPFLVAPTALAQSPQLVLDVNPAPGVGSLGGVWGRGPIDGEVLLSVSDGIHGNELWRSDGTAAGTTLVHDFVPGPGGPIFGGLTVLGDLAFLRIDRGQGYELWRTDGTSAGTVLLHPSAGTSSSLVVYQPATVVSSVLFFSDGVTTWRTDGTVAGTFSLGVPSATPLGPFLGQTLLHAGLTGAVILSDGNTAAVVGNVAGSLRLESEGRLLQWQLGFGPGGLTFTFTALHVPGAPSMSITGTAPPALVTVPGAWLFTSSSALLRWDGLGPPTTLLTASAFGNRWQPLGNKVAFTATTPATGEELWFTDGTAAGTAPIDVVPGPAGSAPQIAVAIDDDVLVFWAAAGGFGSEPFRSDGTTAGTWPLGDLEPGPGSSTVHGQGYEAGGERRALLAIQTTAFGKEMWVTDGTSAGTQLVADIWPGPGSSQITPGGFWSGLGRVCGSAFVWIADDGVHGREPWILPLPGARTPLQRYGARRFDVGDPVLGSTWTLRCAGLGASDLGVVGLGLPLGACLPLGGRQCLHFDPSAAVGIAVVVPGGGTWNGGMPLPNQPALLGVDFVVQPLFVGAGAVVEVGDAHWLSLGF
ncbi:MAG: hypothetical protein WAT39_09730 [Planctomycetota bacterium]